MLFGEHAVLRGKTSIAAAVDRRLRVELTPNDDNDIHIFSSLGNVCTPKNTLSFGNNFRFVEACFSLYKDRLPTGATVTISSTINHTVGLGSSAAVTVALLAALSSWIYGDYTKEQLLQDSCTVIRNVQKIGSGADAASIIWGGVIAYQTTPSCVTPLCDTLDGVLISSGKKVPTAEVIAFVNAKERMFPEIYHNLFETIEDVTQAAKKAIIIKDFTTLGKLMDIGEGLMESLGVGTKELCEICWKLKEVPTILGAKISGSGLGDAVFGLGTLPDDVFVNSRLPSIITPQGVIRET
jgi:mevalonate kinase